MSRALTSVGDLVDEGLVDPRLAPALDPVADTFRIRITPAMRAAMATPDDAVGRQFVPRTAEAVIRPEELMDPIGDAAHAPVPGLTHRYPDRAILHLTQTCEVYCRFCFRREGVGQDGALPDAVLDGALDYIRRTPALREVILTGGDPLVLSPRRIGAVMRALAGIDHLRVIRIHTRIPVVAPERITPDLLGALTVDRPVYLVLHTNHAKEITAGAEAALSALARAGVVLLSQSVLLRGINDDAATLEALFRRLVECRVVPHYLHHCDLARGTSHFRTTIAEGMAIMAALRGRLSGPAIPAYVLDIPGGHGKVPVSLDWMTPGPALAEWTVRDWTGKTHAYRDPARDAVTPDHA